jgi:anthrone oxygenase-like protein
MTIAYDVITATVAATLVGNELAIAAFVHPQLYRLDDHTHVRAAASLAKVLGKRMPVWYVLSLLLILGAFLEHRPLFPASFLILLSDGFWSLVIAGTVIALVPLNNQIARLTPEKPYEGWREDRIKWDRLHRIRVAVLLVAVLLLLTGLLMAAGGPRG